MEANNSVQDTSEYKGSWPNIPKSSELFECLQRVQGSQKIEIGGTVKYWGFYTKKEVEEAEVNGRLLHLDFDFFRKCSLRCPICYRRRNKVDDTDEPDLTYEEKLGIIWEAKRIGLKTVKMCGAGEPFEDARLLRFARQLTDWGVGLSIFTKGQVFGNNNLAKAIYGSEGIRNGRQLAKAFAELKVSIMLSFLSSDSSKQDLLVGNVPGYTNWRNRAAEILAETGFNQGVPSRFALVMAPLTPDNYHDAFPLYVYCRERNILPVIAVLMVSGKQIKGHLRDNNIIEPEKIIELWTKVYKYNIQHGLQSVDDMLSKERETISCMPGIHPCNQIAVGLYVTENGNVIWCPGNGGDGIKGNVHKESLESIWAKVRETYGGEYNVGCPFKVKITLPANYQDAVRQNLNK